MDPVYLLIPIAIVLVGLATWGLFWSVNAGQFDDLDSPAHRILYDDDDAMIPEEARVKTNETKTKQPAPKSDTDNSPESP